MPHRGKVWTANPERPWAQAIAIEKNRITFTGDNEATLKLATRATKVIDRGRAESGPPSHPGAHEAAKPGCTARRPQAGSSLGITSIQNANGDPEELSLYEELLESGELTLRAAFAMSMGPPHAKFEQYARVKQHWHGPLLRVQALKFMMDGVIESHIGDRAVRMALDGYENALRVNGPHDARFRIEHIETVQPSDVPRFAKLGVIPSMQPIHADPGAIEIWSRAVGSQRRPYSFAWQAFLKAGATLLFASDWPACISIDPIRGLHNAVNRRTITGLPANGWLPEQRVSVADALNAYTKNGAYASFEEAIKGTLDPGKLADIVVWSQDLFTIDPMKIHDTKADFTIVDGRIVWQG